MGQTHPEACFCTAYELRIGYKDEGRGQATKEINARGGKLGGRGRREEDGEEKQM